MNHTFSNAKEVIEVYGELNIIRARRNTLVTIREPNGIEIFSRPQGDLTAVEGIDWIVMPLGGNPYPCKKDIFEQTWELTGKVLQTGKVQENLYQKKSITRLIAVPKGDTVTLKTLEGDVNVTYPDYIVLGVQDEVYSNSCNFVKEELEIILKNDLFIVTPLHLKLLQRMYVDWNDCENGAPEIDPKRPYGNSDLTSDIHEILTGVYASEFSDAIIENYNVLHRETQTVLQIALSTLQFQTGIYRKADRYSSNWHFIGEL